MGDLQGKTWPCSGSRETIESDEAFAGRAMSFWRDTLLPCVVQLSGADEEDDSNEAAYVLVTSHGGLIQTLASELVDKRHVRLAHKVRIRKCVNTSICEIVFGGKKAVMTRFGDASHLVEKAVEVNVDEI
jgi:broad specificity phosphatase PhoE